ncbi:MAG: hypothetical protein V1746_03620 [bacterium]
MNEIDDEYPFKEVDPARLCPVSGKKTTFKQRNADGTITTLEIHPPVTPSFPGLPGYENHYPVTLHQGRGEGDDSDEWESSNTLLSEEELQACLKHWGIKQSLDELFPDISR